MSCGTAYNLQNSTTLQAPVPSEAEKRHWYWFYLNSECARKALTEDRRGFCRYLWQDFSPTWKFDDATFYRAAAAFDNPDFIEVVLHSTVTASAPRPAIPPWSSWSSAWRRSRRLPRPPSRSRARTTGSIRQRLRRR